MVAVCLLGQTSARDGWTGKERRAIQDALGCILLDEGDLRFEKKAAPSAPMIPLARDLLDRPLDGPAAALGTGEEAAGGIPGALALAGRLLDVGDLPAIVPVEEGTDRAIPEPLRMPLGQAWRDLEAASEHLESALSAMGEDGLKWALGVAWTLPLEGENPEAKEASAAEPGEGDRRRLYSLWGKTDRARLISAAGLVWRAADRLAEAAAGAGAVGEGFESRLEGVQGRVIYERETPAGAIVVGGPGPNSYSRSALLILDLGGDDRYLDGCGGGDSRRGQRTSVIVDLKGDDIYRSRASVAQGAGYFGIGCLLDLEGDDTYRAVNLAQGAGLFGVGILVDRRGDDTYAGDTAVQGAGMLGVGILHDRAGRDRYDGAIYSQGFAGVMGMGFLVDDSGADLYRAGGVYLHRPLFTDRYRSLSQGFSIGDRYARAGGGLGLLYDGGGNDAYVADIYGQGSSYWYSVGLLVDKGGHDSYTLGQYGQGGGIHLSTGILVDLEGDDSYHCTHGVGQGGGHDYAVGILLDRGGNDYYSGAGLTQGAGNANGIGILLDRSGNDAYAGTKKGIQGHGNPARSFDSIGVLVDMGGEDTYSEGGMDGSVWRGGERGVGLDLEADKEEEE